MANRWQNCHPTHPFSCWDKITNADIQGTKGHKRTAILTLNLTLNQKVEGSIPSWPTNKKAIPPYFGGFLFFYFSQQFTKRVVNRWQGKKAGA